MNTSAQNHSQFLWWAAKLLCWCMLVCLLWRLGALSERELQRQRDLTALRCYQNAPTASNYRDMRRVEARADTPAVFALWAQQDHQRLQAPSTGQESEASVLLVQGDSRLVLPVSSVLAEDDPSGCLIDRRTALELFGDVRVEGLPLRWQEREYIIRGVFHAPAATLVVHPDVDHTAPLPNIALELSANDEASSFVMRHGLSVGYTLEHRVWLQAATLFTHLPHMALGLFLLEWLVELLRRNRQYPVRSGVLLILLLALCTGAFLWLLTLLPPGWTPSRWSDFSHWNTLAENTRDALASWLQAARYRPDLLTLGTVAGTLRCVLAALCLLPCRRLLQGIPPVHMPESTNTNTH